jgi:uncharacterized membrane protein YbhN (UPF0104 family)
MAEKGSPTALGRSLDAAGHDVHRALSDTRRHLKRRALELVLYVVVAYGVLKLLPTLKQAVHSLEHVSWEWIVGAIAIEVVSELGFVVSWRAIIDPQNMLQQGGRGRRTANRIAWAQLGGGLVVPGGSYGGIGIGGLILHRFGMATKVIARRQFSLSFLNTAISALAIIFFGAGLATRLFSGQDNLLLTLLPAAIAAAGLWAAGVIAIWSAGYADRLKAKHPKIAAAITTLAQAVHDTKELLFHRVGLRSVLGAVTYLVLEILVLFLAFNAVHAHPVPGFAIVVMAYVIGALAGSLPLPAALGTVGGVAGMLIVYGVPHNPAVAATLVHQAIGLIVPLVGGAISYAVLRRRLGPIVRIKSDDGASDRAAAPPAASEDPHRST